MVDKCIDGSHEKVYADYYLMSNPPQQPWICSKCGEQGNDLKVHNRVTYEDVIRKFKD
ncbi:hypothetical protein PCURB6_27430 [Paenibacillus curdlanolyticus]|nr:hypothetical protein PCURB6_27430 [Paenibacillus curdlanolyticus]